MSVPVCRELLPGEALGRDTTVAGQVKASQGKKVREIPRIGKLEVTWQNYWADSTKPEPGSFPFRTWVLPAFR